MLHALTYPVGTQRASYMCHTCFVCEDNATVLNVRSNGISLVIPAFNEEAGIAVVLDGFSKLNLFDEIIVVDNNSTDNTALIAHGLGARVIRESNQGYGFALRRGIHEATGSIIVLTEADGTFDPIDSFILLSSLKKYDLVKSSRSHRYLVDVNAEWNNTLKLGNFVLAKFMQILYFGTKFYELPSLREMGGTFRAFHKEFYVSKIDPWITENGSAYLADMTSLYIRCEGRILELPLSYLPRYGKSKVTGNKKVAIALGFRMLFVIVRNRFRKM